MKTIFTARAVAQLSTEALAVSDARTMAPVVTSLDPADIVFK